MADSEFDPYHKWLGIPPKQQPANYYRLLGVDRFESDPDVIESAAMRQISHLRSFSIGEHGELSQTLLNEITEAKLCLLSLQSKSEYDKTLRELDTPGEQVATVRCPACSAALTINKSLYGKLVKCPKCAENIQISNGGNKLSQTSLTPKGEQISPFNTLPQSGLTPFAVKSKAISVDKAGTAKGSHRKKSSLNRLLIHAIPIGTILGICLAILILTSVLQKDPSESTLADANLKNNERNATISSRIAGGDQKKVPPENPDRTGNEHSVVSLQSSGSLPTLAIAPFDAAKAQDHQEAWAKHLGMEVQKENSIGMRFVLIPPGTCSIGSFAFEENEKPIHKAHIDYPFELGVCEVTQEQYARVMGTNPSLVKASSHPVENVTWLQAVQFCNELSLLPKEREAGYEYRLPTENEWEYACRAGTTTDYSFPFTPEKLGDFAWLSENSEGRSHPVGQKQANPWMLHDMHGNVWEWCLTGLYPYQKTVGQALESQMTTNPIRIQRGAGWGASVEMARSGFRGAAPINYRGKDHGFRVLRFKKKTNQPSAGSPTTPVHEHLSINLLKRINSTPENIHKDWRRNADGTLSANVHANHDVLKIPVPELSSLSSFGLVFEFGNNGKRTGKPRFSIKVPYNDSKHIVAGYYYGRTYNMSVGLEGAGAVSTRHFLGYHSLTLNVTHEFIDVAINGRSLGRINHKRDNKPMNADRCVLELSGISGSWMHFHLKSVHLLAE